MNVDYRDMVIRQLTDGETVLIERLVIAQADCDAYRALAMEGVHALHRLAQKHDRLREQNDRLLDEYRTLRARVLSASVAI